RDEEGGIIGLVGTAEDITPYTEALEKVRASERLLQTVIDTLPQAVFLKDLQGGFVIVNDAYARSHGMTKEEALQVKIPQLPGGTDEQKNQWAAQDRHVLETGTATPTEIIPFNLPSGEVRIRTLTKLPVHDANGVLAGILGVSDDITERQEAEQRVRQSQRLLQTVIDTCPQAIFLKNADGRYLVINDTFARIRGLSKSDILGANNSELPHASREEQAQWVEDDRRVIGQGVTIGPKEYPFTLPDGGLTMRMLYKLPVQDESGAVIGVLGVSEDITERRKQEMALRESERLLQTMFDAIPLDVWVKGRDRRYVRVNPAMARRWHTTPEAMVGQMAPTTDQTPEGEAGRIATSDLHVLEEGKMLDQYMLRTEPDGRRRIHHQIKSPLRNEAGEVIGIVGVAEDVTEMRRAEQELRASREQLRLVLEATAEGWWECDIPSQRMQYSPGWQRLFGYSEAEIPKTTDEWKALIHPEDVERVLRTVVGSLKEEDGRFEAEYRVRHRSGEYVWVADRGKVVARDSKGMAVRQVGAFFDIRRRKRAEEDLKASQRLLQTVFDTIPHPVFVKDREGRYMAVNRAMTDLWQTTAERVIGQKVILQTHRPENEARNTQQSDQEVMSTGQPQAFIRTQTLLDGKVHRLDMKKTPLLDESGRVIGLVGVLQDITEREQAQEALRDNQRLLNAVINALPWGLTAKDKAGRFMLVNPTVLSFYNTTPDALLGRTSLDIPWFSADDRQRFYDEDMQVIRSGKVLEVP
ncbi:MAG TPA: PAS domain S-box protein, partial [bacterium]